MIQIFLTATLLMATNASGVDSREFARHEIHLLEAVAEMPRDAQMLMYLGNAPSAPKQASRYSQEARIRRLTQDPAIQELYDQIDELYFTGALTRWGSRKPLFKSPRELVQLKVMIARNLYFRETTVSPRSVRNEYKRIQRLRQRYRSLKLFQGRNVVYAVSGDHLRFGEEKVFLFGRRKHQRRLGQQADQLTFYRPGSGPQGTKAMFESRIHSKRHLTLLFEGHGRSNALKLAGKLSSGSLARQFQSRSNRELSIVVLDVCQGHTFSRRMLESFRRSGMGASLPVIITPEEYGQDIFKGVYNDRFLNRELKLGSRDSVSLGNLIDDASMTTSVYVPDEDNVATQIM